MNEIILPIIQRIIPKITAAELLNVQPMVGPAGEIFALNRANPRKCYE
jgi:hypothetical protein